MARAGDLRRVILCWLVCALSLAPSSRLAAKDKEKKERNVRFGKEVLVALGGLNADGTCVSYRAFVSSGNFFDTLERLQTQAGFEFRKNGAVVKTFPDEIQLGLDAEVAACPNDLIPSPIAAPPASPDFVQHPKLAVHWKRGAGLRPAEILALEVHQVPWQETKNVWYYLVQIRSKDVPLADQLEVSVLGRDSQRLGVLTGGLIDIWAWSPVSPADQKRH